VVTTTDSDFFEPHPTRAVSTENPNAVAVIAERCIYRSPAQKILTALEDIGPSGHRLTEKKPRRRSALKVCHLSLRTLAVPVEYAAQLPVPWPAREVIGRFANPNAQARVLHAPFVVHKMTDLHFDFQPGFWGGSNAS
jgi:hypothetical protein